MLKSISSFLKERFIALPDSVRETPVMTDNGMSITDHDPIEIMRWIG